MKKMIFLLSILMIIAVSGCAAGQGGGGYGSPSGHQGHH